MSIYSHPYFKELYHYGVKGMKWGVRRSPEELARARQALESSEGNDKMKEIIIGKSVGSKFRNYEVYDPDTDEYFNFVEGTRIKNPKVFAGKGGVNPLKDSVKEGLSEQIGGNPSDWQHCKGEATLDFYGEERKAEVHWFQEESVGKHKFKVKEWLED